MSDKPDEFADYFRSDLHNRRIEDASRRTVENLSAIGKGDLFHSFSEAIGMVAGVASFYATFGLKHQAILLFKGMINFLRKGENDAPAGKRPR